MNHASRVAQPQARTAFRPRVNIFETPTEFRLSAEVAGATPENTAVEVKDNVMSVRVAVADRPRASAKQVVGEYSVGDFERTFQLGENIALDKLEAKVADGVLTIRLPKAESVQPKKIVVSSGS
jgi:HSP20 family protein